jgi:toxin ParE1/3/4
MPFKVVLRPQAEADLESIYRFIENDSRARAMNYIRRLRKRCEALRYFPERGRPRDDILPGLRILTFERSAVIEYMIEGDQVRIVDIFYRGRDYEAILRGAATDKDG